MFFLYTDLLPVMSFSYTNKTIVIEKLLHSNPILLCWLLCCQRWGWQIKKPLIICGLIPQMISDISIPNLQDAPFCHDA